MSPPRLKQTSIISLSSFDTSDNHNTNNNKNYFTERQLPVNTKSFTQTLDQAVEYFEHILNQCAATSNTSLIRNNDQQERRNVLKSSKLELKKRDRDDGLRSINKKENVKRKPKINCRKWCEEQNRQMTKYDYLMERSHSRNQHPFGSIFFCRKALLQKPNGTTYICIRKRSN